MTIKSLAFDAQQYLESQTGATFKRGHIYELLTASLGQGNRTDPTYPTAKHRSPS